MRQFLLAVGAALVFACGTTTSGPVSGSGGGGGTPPPPPAGGASDAGNPDRGIDAGAPDPGTTADAGATPDAGTTGRDGDAGVTGSNDAGTTTGGGGSDGGTISADCQGLVPDSLGSSFSFDVPPPAGGTTQCDSASSDEKGNLIANNDGANPVSISWELFSPQGAHLAHLAAWSLFPQPRGWVGAAFGPSHAGPPNEIVAYWLPDGTTQKDTGVAGDESGVTGFRSWPNGLVAVSVFCTAGPPGSTTVRRFDAEGNLLSQSSFPTGCDFLSAVGDANGNTLILEEAMGGELTARWLDSSGNPLTPFFVFSPGPLTGPVLLHSVVGGGAVMAVGGEWKWSFESGTTHVSPAPEWLAQHTGYDFSIVRGERAYALLPRTSGDSHVMDLVSTQGTRCGSLTFPVGGLTTGADGSVIAASGNSGCTKTVWPGLLR